MTAGDWPTAAADIAARWEHGHDQLTDGCALCTAEYNEVRQLTDQESPMTTTMTTAVHRPLTLLVGGTDCLERECDEYLTETGDNDPAVERCSHITEENVCATCSTEQPDGEYEPIVAWPCNQATTETP